MNGYVKVRVSDHDATNIGRMASEIMIGFDGNAAQVIEKFEKIVFADRFTSEVKIVENIQEAEVQPHQLAATDIILSERIAKSGNLHYTVKRTYLNEITVLTRKN